MYYVNVWNFIILSNGTDFEVMVTEGGWALLEMKTLVSVW